MNEVIAKTAAMQPLLENLDPQIAGEVLALLVANWVADGFPSGVADQVLEDWGGTVQTLAAIQREFCGIA